MMQLDFPVVILGGACDHLPYVDGDVHAPASLPPDLRRMTQMH